MAPSPSVAVVIRWRRFGRRDRSWTRPRLTNGGEPNVRNRGRGGLDLVAPIQELPNGVPAPRYERVTRPFGDRKSGLETVVGPNGLRDEIDRHDGWRATAHAPCELVEP